MHAPQQYFVTVAVTCMSYCKLENYYGLVLLKVTEGKPYVAMRLPRIICCCNTAMARSLSEKGGVGGDSVGEDSVAAAALAACTTVARADATMAPLTTTIVVSANPATIVLTARLGGAAGAALAAVAAELGTEAAVTPLAAAEVVGA